MRHFQDEDRLTILSKETDSTEPRECTSVNWMVMFHSDGLNFQRQTDSLTDRQRQNRPVLKYAASLWSAPLRMSDAERHDGSLAETAKHLTSTQSWTPCNGKYYNNEAEKPGWRCSTSSTTALSPSSPAVCQNPRAADWVQERTAPAGMTSLHSSWTQYRRMLFFSRTIPD